MSDVPAAACWLLAAYFASRGSVGSAAAAGALVALASMIRPNLQPLAVVPAVVLLVADAPMSPRAWRWREACVFVALALVGQVTNASSQYLLYGSPWRPGYAGWETFFRLEHIAPNIRAYPRLFVETFGFLPLLGLLGFAMAGKCDSLSSRGVVRSAGGLIAINIILYLTYLPYDHWPFLRFFLPAIVALEVLCAAVVVWVARAINTRSSSPWGTLVIPVAVAVVLWTGRGNSAFALGEWRSHARIPMMGHYLREALPRNAVVLSYLHGGAVAHYTGHNVVSLEVLAPEAFEPLLRDLENNGCAPVLVVDEAFEAREFRQAFAHSGYAALDWPSRAEFITTSKIRYFLVSDRDRYMRGDRWVTDILR